jgi:hypothetical protein
MIEATVVNRSGKKLNASIMLPPENPENQTGIGLENTVYRRRAVKQRIRVKLKVVFVERYTFTCKYIR